MTFVYGFIALFFLVGAPVIVHIIVSLLCRLVGGQYDSKTNRIVGTSRQKNHMIRMNKTYRIYKAAGWPIPRYLQKYSTENVSDYLSRYGS